MVRNAMLFVLMFGAFAGGSTVRLDWTRGGTGMKIASLAYTVIVFYALYQAVARRLMWPFAFLRVTNPTYQTDPIEPGLQYGITGASREWGEYFFRASATFSEPSYLGQYLVYGLIAGLALIALGGRHARAGFIAVGLAMLGLLANYSLTGLLVFGVVGTVMLLPLLLQVRFVTLLRLGAAAGVIILIALRWFPAIYENVAYRLSTLSIENSSGRFEAWPVMVEALKERPWGAGLSLVAFDNDIYSAVALIVLQFGIIGVLLPALWASSIVAGMIILITRRRALAPASRAALMAGTGFLAAQLAGWLVSGEMRHALAWILSGVAFGTLGRIVERPIRLPGGVKRAPRESAPVAAQAHSS